MTLPKSRPLIPAVTVVTRSRLLRKIEAGATSRSSAATWLRRTCSPPGVVMGTESTSSGVRRSTSRSRTTTSCSRPPWRKMVATSPPTATRSALTTCWGVRPNAAARSMSTRTVSSGTSSSRATLASVTPGISSRISRTCCASRSPCVRSNPRISTAMGARPPQRGQALHGQRQLCAHGQVHADEDLALVRLRHDLSAEELIEPQAEGKHQQADQVDDGAVVQRPAQHAPVGVDQRPGPVPVVAPPACERGQERGQDRREGGGDGEGAEQREDDDGGELKEELGGQDFPTEEEDRQEDDDGGEGGGDDRGQHLSGPAQRGLLAGPSHLTVAEDVLQGDGGGGGQNADDQRQRPP